MSWVLGPQSSPGLVARLYYVLTLVPIAVGYNVAHNYSYLLIQGQAFLTLLSDPFGFGWDLFGTAGRQPDLTLTVVDARTIWYVAVGAIVVGHIIALYLAHIVALRISPTRQSAIRTLYPMTVLMVLYTGASLSILAEPIVRFSMPDPSYSFYFTPFPIAPGYATRCAASSVSPSGSTPVSARWGLRYASAQPPEATGAVAQATAQPARPGSPTR